MVPPSPTPPSPLPPSPPSLSFPSHPGLPANTSPVSQFGFPFEHDDDYGMHAAPALRGGAAQRRNKRFDEYFRCYPISVLDRRELNYGGKIIMPPSALEKLTRLHIAYPMLFELRNGSKDKTTHAGVLEFIAEEGRVYLPYWVCPPFYTQEKERTPLLTRVQRKQMMQTLSLDPGDLLQIKSTDLPSGSFIKLQPQSMAFINAISDPKAVLENVLRNFSALTTSDTFQFLYNDDVFEIGVLEVKPRNPSGAISCVETDLEVDFAPPLDYVEPTPPVAAAAAAGGLGSGSGAGSAGSSRPGSVVGGGRVTPITHEGSMAKAIGYAALSGAAGAAGAAGGGVGGSGGTAAAAGAASAAFSGTGQRLKGSRTGTPTARPSTPASSALLPPPATVRKGTGPQPLRLPPGKLFFGYEIRPVKKDGEASAAAGEKKPSLFSGGGQTLRGTGGRKRKGGEGDVKGKGRSRADPVELD